MADQPIYFVDECLIAVGRALAHVRADVVHPGHAALPEIPEGTKDPVWLPIVGERKLIVITRDQGIRTKPAELKLFNDNHVRAFFLTGKKDMSKWDKFAMLVRMWDRVEKTVAKSGPGPWQMSLVNNNIKPL